MKSIYFVIYIVSVVLAKQSSHHKHSHLAKRLKAKEIFNIQINNKIQNVMNKMFDSVKLPKRFLDEPNIKLLLTIFYGLNNIALKKKGIYDVLKKVAAVDIKNKVLKKIGLEEMISETLKDNKIKEHEKIIQTRETIQTISIPRRPITKFNDSKQFNELIKAFLHKINSLTIDDFIKKKNATNTFKKRKKDLVIWQPPKAIQRNNNFTKNRRIYKGKRCLIDSYPFIVSISILNRFVCAGNIISKDLILTAASCLQLQHNNRFFREMPKTVFVRVGSSWTAWGGEIIPVIELYFHPQYNPKTLRHNLVIARLEKVLYFRKEHKIKRIQLDRSEGNLASSTEDLLILGWGPKNRYETENKYVKLSVSQLDVYHIEECKKVYLSEYVTENHFCAGFYTKGAGACNRDVGGPGIVGGVLVGIISFGSPVCGMPNAPTVFTRVGPYIDWIERVKQLVPVRHRMTISTPVVHKLGFFFHRVPTHPYLTPVQHEDHTTKLNQPINTPKVTERTLKALRVIKTIINETDKSKPELNYKANNETIKYINPTIDIKESEVLNKDDNDKPNNNDNSNLNANKSNSESTEHIFKITKAIYSHESKQDLEQQNKAYYEDNIEKREEEQTENNDYELPSDMFDDSDIY